jgi:hypothetical protein
MQPLMEFQGAALYNQWSLQSDKLRDKAVQLWKRNSILPHGAAADDRARELVVVAVSASGEAIGVNTVYKGELPKAAPDEPTQQCYYYRMFIQKESRKPHLMRIMTNMAHDVLRVNRRVGDPETLAIITDNLALIRPGMLALFERYGGVPLMRLPSGKLLIIKKL